MAIAACLLIGCVFSLKAMTPDVAAKVASAESGSTLQAQTAAVIPSNVNPSLTLVTRNIEDIKAGDLVLARYEHGSEIRLKPVKETYQRTSDHLRHLTFESPDGTQQTLSTTDEHPFWSVTADAFVNAGSLIVGHTVTGPDGATQSLISSTREEFPNGIPVFNFQVKDFHTYFVAASADKPVMLVHNADCSPNFPAGVGSADIPEFRGKMNTTLEGTMTAVAGVKQKIKGTISQNALHAEELAQQIAAAKGIDNPIIRVHPGHKGVGLPHLHVDGIDGWHFWYQ